VPAAEYAARFEEILALGNRDWVNLGVVDVQDGALIVAVEFFTAPSASHPRHFARDEIHVMFFGPERSRGFLKPE
jgi:hypothetical protein